jgi:hypothetical protein
MRWFVLSIFLFLSQIGRTQSFADSTFALSVSFQYHPYDFFFGIGCRKAFNSHYLGASFYTGINRTFFQGRYYPKMGMSYGVDILRYSSVHLIPELHLNGSILDIGAATKQVAKYFEMNAGISLGYGRKNQCLLHTQIGPMWSFYMPQKALLSWNVSYEIRYLHHIH